MRRGGLVCVRGSCGSNRDVSVGKLFMFGSRYRDFATRHSLTVPLKSQNEVFSKKQLLC